MRVFVGKVESNNISDAVRAALHWINWETIVPMGSHVFIKPNLTWVSHLPGITTSPAFLSALVELIRERTRNITIGESDGGYNSFKADEAFRGHGLDQLASRYGVKLINLSTLPAEERTGVVAGRAVTVRLPRYLLRDVEVFLTAPVPKIHATTGVSLGLKNQWGCIPDAMRLREHAEFDGKIVLINKLLRPKMVLFDGLYFLDKTGPLVGEPVCMNLVVASDDVGAGSMACCEIMGVDPFSVKHQVVARKEGLFPASLREVAINTDLSVFRQRSFRLERTPMNWVAFAAFNSRLLTKVIYDSRFADWAHLVLYKIRHWKLFSRLAYGRLGAPPIEGHR
jgi:uncharacterized protein (DUF362 family)